MKEEGTADAIIQEDGDSIEIIFTEENDRKKARVNYSYTTLEQDMKLAYEVKKHCCLYDKRSPEFKRNNDPTNERWSDVAAALDWISNGVEACRLFEVLKKRYSKKKMNYKRATHYLNSEEQIQKAESELDKYNFLNWLEPHIRYRTAKLTDDTEEGFYQDENVAEDNQSFHVVELRTNENERKRKTADYASFKPNQNRSQDSIPFNGVTPSKITRSNDYTQEDEEISRGCRTNNGHSHPYMVYGKRMINDEDELFVAMVLTQLKGLSEREKCLAKHEISNTLFKAQLKQLDDKHPIEKPLNV